MHRLLSIYKMKNMFVKLAWSFEPLNKSWVQSRNLGWWQPRHWKEDKHAQCFPFSFITLMSHVSPSWEGGVNSYKVRKKKKHINWDLSIFRLLTPSFKSLISNGCGGRIVFSVDKMGGSANVWYAFAVKILHYDTFNLKGGPAFPAIWKIK